jgi:hypothetical protein
MGFADGSLGGKVLMETAHYGRALCGPQGKIQTEWPSGHLTEMSGGSALLGPLDAENLHD